MVLFDPRHQLRLIDTAPGETAYLIGTNGWPECPSNQGVALEGRW